MTTPADATAIADAVAAELGTSATSVTRLAGGYRTDNWRLQLATGLAVVARRYHPERSACAVEAALLERVAGVVPVPEVVLADPKGLVAGTPILVTTFVDGVSAATVARDGSPDDVAGVAAAAGRSLAAVASVRFERPGFFSGNGLDVEPIEPGIDAAMAWVRSTLDRAGTVDGRLRDAWWGVLSATARRLLPGERPVALTHSDYNPKNLLVAQRPSGEWTVSAVLDWEFAYAGDPLADVGNWLRLAARYPDAYAGEFVAGYRSAGGDLPSDWTDRAKLLDAMAIADFLAAGPERAYYAEALALVRAAVSVG